ncbi:TPA: hypothetical protein ACG3I4_002373 [Clostridioides difficile]
MAITTRKELLDRLENNSVNIKNMNLEIKKSRKEDNLKDFYNLFNQFNDEDYLMAIKETMDYFIEKKWDNVAKKLISDIINSTGNRGSFFELMGYYWFIKNRIRFSPQIEISEEECFKRNKYDADGIIEEGSIVFDIKTFGTGTSIINDFEKLLNDKIRRERKISGYFCYVSGDLSQGDEKVQKDCFKKVDEIIEELLKHKTYDSYIYKIPKIGLELRMEPSNVRYYSPISELDIYKWAKENEFCFMKDASQFTRQKPYVLIALFDKYSNRIIHTNKNYYNNLILRTLCRRIFMNLPNINSKKLIDFDKKAVEDITIAEVSKKISGIIFMDSSNNFKESIYTYINPNADNKLKNYQVDIIFKQNGAYIDDFKYDNY